MRYKNIITDLPTIGAGWHSRDLDLVTDITVHHSASPLNYTAWTFARYHTNPTGRRLKPEKRGKGYPGIAYHIVIDPDGTINQTLPFTAYSYHNGFNNRVAIGVCLIGNFDRHPPTTDQLAALAEVIPFIRLQVPSIKYLMGHNEYPLSSKERRAGVGKTLCPGRFMPVQPLREQHGLAQHPAADLIH